MPNTKRYSTTYCCDYHDDDIDWGGYWWDWCIRLGKSYTYSRSVYRQSVWVGPNQYKYIYKLSQFISFDYMTANHKGTRCCDETATWSWSTLWDGGAPNWIARGPVTNFYGRYTDKQMFGIDKTPIGRTRDVEGTRM